jgi:hypothetical protein
MVELELVPGWFGIEPNQARELIVRILEDAGGTLVEEASDSSTVQLSSSDARRLSVRLQVERNKIEIKQGLRVLELSERVLEHSTDFSSLMKTATRDLITEVAARLHAAELRSIA